MVLVGCMLHPDTIQRACNITLYGFEGVGLVIHSSTRHILLPLGLSASRIVSQSSTTMLDAWKFENCLARLTLYAKTPRRLHARV